MQKCIPVRLCPSGGDPWERGLLSVCPYTSILTSLSLVSVVQMDSWMESEGRRGRKQGWVVVDPVVRQPPSIAWYGQMRTALCQNLEPLSPAWTLHQDDECGSSGFPGLLVFLEMPKIIFVQNVSRFIY